MVASPVNPHLIGGRYRLESSIASGGMAEVWRATDMQLRRLVAVKMLKPSVIDDKQVAERFRREARALARLSHSHIVPVYDCVEEDNQVALVMELIHGKSLRELLDAAGDGERAGTISVHLTVRIGTAIALALAASHRANILHRDIKPGNILVTSDGRVLLADFGIAKPLKSTEDDGTDLTHANIMMGTAKYLSPEQVQGRELDGRADMYSLGLVLYECLAGNAPFKAENDQATAVARLQRDPTPLAQVRPDVPMAVISVVERMLRRKPEHRYDDCEIVAKALEEAIRHTHESVTPATGTEVSPRPRQSRTSDVGDPLIGKRTTRDDGSVQPPRRDRTPPSGQPRKPPRGDVGGDDAPQQKDRTPRGMVQADGAVPKRQRTNTSRSYVSIGLLLVTALVMSVMLWRGLQSTRGDLGAPAAPATFGPVELVGLRSFDPGGDDGAENESMIGALRDANPATTWTTVCYGNRYFGSKGGVGIIAQLSGVGLGTLSATFANGPWSADVFVASGETPPTTLDGWGPRVADNFGRQAASVDFQMRTAGNWVLLFLREAGRHPTCSNNNPFKSELSSVSFTNAP